MGEIRPVEAGDYDNIAEFLTGFGQGDRPREFWLRRMRHWWDQNPVWSERICRGWRVDEKSQTVGFIGVIPRAIETFEGSALSSNMTTYWVLPEHRKHSLALLVRTLGASMPVQFNTTPGDAVVPLLEGLRFVPFPGVRRDYESLLVVDPLPLLGTLASRRAPAFAKVPAGVWRGLGAPARAGLAAFRSAKRIRSHLQSRLLSSVGPEFDALWDARRERKLTAGRDAKSLNWFVFGNPDRPKTLIGCFEGRALAGFLILAEREHPSLKLLDCVDFFLGADDTRVVESLVLEASECARRAGVAFVGFRHFSPFLAGCFRALGLLERKAEAGREFIRAPQLKLDPATAYLTQFHGDRWL
jgi:hypothetical protein